MEVKGDFCRQVQAMLQRAGRDDDYVEIGLDTGVCYNPLHNDLDPYAVAYAIATLLNNLFGKSKEPFWQQAYTDLLKFVILLRRLTDGYTTFAEVYRYILDDELIDRDIRTLKPRSRSRRTSCWCRMEEYRAALTRSAVDSLVPGRRGPHGAPVRRRARDLSRRAGVPFERAHGAGRRLGRPGGTSSRPSSAGTSTAGAGSMRGSARPSPKASSCSCRCSTTTPRCTARSVRRAVPTWARRKPGEPRPLPAHRDVCSRPATCSP